MYLPKEDGTQTICNSSTVWTSGTNTNQEDGCANKIILKKKEGEKTHPSKSTKHAEKKSFFQAEKSLKKFRRKWVSLCVSW